MRKEEKKIGDTMHAIDQRGRPYQELFAVSVRFEADKTSADKDPTTIFQSSEMYQHSTRPEPSPVLGDKYAFRSKAVFLERRYPNLVPKIGLSNSIWLRPKATWHWTAWQYLFRFSPHSGLIIVALRRKCYCTLQSKWSDGVKAQNGNGHS